MATVGLQRKNHATPRELLDRLIAFPTVSSSSNLELIDFVRGHLVGYGVGSHLVWNEEKTKANLYATIGPMVPGGVVLSGHTDVVPAGEEAWSDNPFKLSYDQGKFFGRGTSDMKGFVALVLAAVPDMVSAGLKAPIHIALSYDEEVGCKGAPSLVREMVEHVPKPRAVIVGEPTRMKIVTGHKESVSFFTSVRGHPAHSSRIDQGVSAVMVAARLVTWLEDRMVQNSRTADRASLFQPNYTTLHCGVINGGTAANVVAGSCTFTTDIRAVPTDDAWAYKAEYEAYAREILEPAMQAIAPNTGIDIRDRGFVPGLHPEPNGSAQTLVQGLLGDADVDVVSYGTEAGLFQKAGWSTVVCGPGDIAQAHCCDEFIEESQLLAGQQFLNRLIAALSS